MFGFLKWIVLALIIVGLMGSGVLEIRFHADAASGLPQRVAGMFGNAGAGESARVWLTALKRSGEQWIIKDDHQKLTVATGYITSDADRLLELIADEPGDAASVLPQADLLLASIERASDIIASADVDAIAEAREDAEGALASAAGALTKLKELQAEAEALQERFSETTDALSDRIGGFVADADETEEVDAQVSEAEPTESGALQQEVEATAIPLDF
ncbi:hypothetical protein CL628_03685 [bacterium]|nr:hypothetical protein [bacterium]|tara:strand:- start:850 stop:1500 length:651 start_codon:yes stop_codon:yes gene_type:complete